MEMAGAISLLDEKTFELAFTKCRFDGDRRKALAACSRHT